MSKVGDEFRFRFRYTKFEFEFGAKISTAADEGDCAAGAARARPTTSDARFEEIFDLKNSLLLKLGQASSNLYF